MPDRLKKTISATQSPALFNVSPYFTRWMLYRHFAKDMPLDIEPNVRMTWGLKLQPLIIDQAAEDLKFEICPNLDNSYHRNGLLGCTRDAMIVCPDRGPGALETKCVFDFATWMREWDGGKSVPRHHEIQLQQQMMVGNGAAPWTWGVIAAWVAGDVFYFERKPIPLLWDKLREEAARFFGDVHGGREPDPFGSPLELPWMRDLFPTEKGKVVDVADDPIGPEIADIAVRYRDAREQQSAGESAAEPLRAKLLAFAKDANEILLPSGVRVRITTSGPHKGKRITVFVPETAGVRTTTNIGEILNAG